ncbi:hypothetical protein HAX54_017984, partial [Datura stramonium]|nr:hypothetical protein [Datura stramonium]
MVLRSDLPPCRTREAEADQKRGGSQRLTGGTPREFRKTSVWRRSEPISQIVNWEFKKSPTVDPAKCRYSPAVADLVRVE